MIDQKVIEAFHLMWGKFPEPVMLVQRDRTVVAVNETAKSAHLTAGIKCSSLNPENEGDCSCRQCQAAQALRENTAKWMFGDFGGRRIKGFWVPLAGLEDLYLHFSIGLEPSAG